MEKRTQTSPAYLLKLAQSVSVSYTHLDVYKRQVVLTAINVEGSEVTQTFDFHIVRPQIPEVLYLHYNGEVVEMTRSAENPYLYLTEVSGSEEGYPMELTGKISTTESLDDAQLIWGAAEKSNTAAVSYTHLPGIAYHRKDKTVNASIVCTIQRFKSFFISFLQ